MYRQTIFAGCMVVGVVAILVGSVAGAGTQIVSPKEGNVGTKADGNVNAGSQDPSIADKVENAVDEPSDKIKVWAKIFAPPTNWKFKSFLTPGRRQALQKSIESAQL